MDISDTLMYVYEMLGVELLSNLYDRLGRQLMDPQLSAVWQVCDHWRYTTFRDALWNTLSGLSAEVLGDADHLKVEGLS